MQKLSREDLYSLENYAKLRPDFRAKVLSHKKNRTLRIGPNATLLFEDRTTIQYQIQEMLRIERIFEEDGIGDELAAYNPLIPDGRNLKATFMLEYEDIEERRRALAKLLGVEERVWVRADDMDKTWSIADEDLQRTTDQKTSAVHFLRFEFTPETADTIKGGAVISVGIEHDAYRHEVSPVPDSIRRALVVDLD